MSVGFPLRRYLNPVFIETGTYRGAGVEAALKAGFGRIVSIELSDELHAQAARRFEREIRAGRVTLVCGDSAQHLPAILDELRETATFWLDAHYSSGETARGREDVPLLRELEVIGRHRIRRHTLLIDDVRLFATRGSEDWSGVSLDAVLALIERINGTYRVHYERGVVENDVLVAELGGPMERLKRWLRCRSLLRRAT